MRGDPAPARAGRRNSGACRKDSGIDTRARWPADKSCAQCFKHRAQRRWIYASPDPQPLAGRQHQFQNNICGSLRPNGSCFHQCESHRLPLSQPLPPIVEGLFRNLLLPTKLLHGHPAALLRSNPFAPTFFSVSDFLFHAGSLPSWPTMRDPNRIKNSGSQGAYLVSGLEGPWEITWGPDNMLWVTERTGKRVTRINPATRERSVAVTIGEVSAPGGQDGLLGMALHPELLKGTGNDY